MKHNEEPLNTLNEQWVLNEHEKQISNSITRLKYRATRLPQALSAKLESSQLTTSLTQLDLSECNLRQWPSVIFKLNTLTDLELNYNFLSSVPDDIAKLTNLTDLSLRTNLLNSWPTAVLQLTKLKRLYLSTSSPTNHSPTSDFTRQNKNQIEQIPDEIKNLTSLCYLGLSNVSLKKIPDNIIQINNLQILYIENNLLRTLPTFNPKTEVLSWGNPISILDHTIDISTTSTTPITTPAPVAPQRKLLSQFCTYLCQWLPDPLPALDINIHHIDLSQ